MGEGGLGEPSRPSGRWETAGGGHAPAGRTRMRRVSSRWIQKNTQQAGQAMGAESPPPRTASLCGLYYGRRPAGRRVPVEGPLLQPPKNKYTGTPQPRTHP